MSKRGLGRGLGALLGEAGTSDVTTHTTTAAPAGGAAGPSGAAPREGLPQIPVASIRANPFQPRTTFAPEGLEELRASIATFGVLVPVIVRERPDGYELIAGERRWRAAQAAGLETIPAIVRAADDRESLEVAIIENLQRENLDPLEEAMGVQHLMEAHDFTQEQVAQRLGRSRPAIANALRLLSLPDSVKQLVRDGKLSAAHARTVLSFPPERREAMARRAADEQLSVRALERLAQDAAPKRARASATARDANDEYVERLRYRYATQVRVLAQERGGTIELRYADPADLLRIVDLLLGEQP
jgi:ParB family transcriptional regulator, chromosome partitioning protein